MLSAERAAHPGPEQRPPVGRDRQPLLQACDEGAEQHASGDVDRERDPRPVPGDGRSRLDQGGPRAGAHRPAGEDRGQLTTIGGHVRLPAELQEPPSDRRRLTP